MENSSNSFTLSPSAELTREELAGVAYMCYLLNRSQTTRWYHEWRVFLDKMVREGWTMKGLYYRGLVRRRIEQIYGLSPFHSRRAVKAYPPVNMGLEPWQDLTDESVNDLAGQIYREYMGIPGNRYAFNFSAGCEGDENTTVRAVGSDNGQEYIWEENTDEDMGGFYFI